MPRLFAVGRSAAALALLATLMPATARVGNSRGAPAHPTASAPAKRGSMISIVISPGSRLISNANREVEVTIDFCQEYNSAYWDAYQRVWLDAVDISSSFSSGGGPGQTQECEYVERWTGTVTLAEWPGIQTLRAEAMSSTNYAGTASVTFAIPVKDRGVFVAADAGFVSDPPSSSKSRTFTVWNSGEYTTSYTLGTACSGAMSSCSVSPSSVSLSPLGSASVTVSYATSSTVSANGTLTLTATDAADAGTTGAGTMTTTVTSAPSAGIVFARALDPKPKGSCVTVSLGSDAAMECGELRITHALPGVITLGSARVPTLIYSSQHAHPTPVFQADVALPSGISTVEARVYIYGVQKGYASFSGWGAGETRRIAVPADVDGIGRGLLSVEMTVTLTGGSGGSYSTGTVLYPHVDRATSSIICEAYYGCAYPGPPSALGSGWWLAGVQELVDVNSSYAYIVDGDGGTALFVRDWSTYGDAVVYRAANYARPDSIICRCQSGQPWVRRYPNGSVLQFDHYTGLQLSTTTPEGQVTSFTYEANSRRLSTITIPVRSGSPLTYTFGYASGLLRTVTAPNAGTARVDTITISSGRITSIKDADGHSVSFGYGSGANANRIESRTDRRGYTTTFSYNSSSQLTGSTASNIGSGQSPAMTLRPAESVGLGTAASLDSAYTRIDGPRSDVTDVTKIWVNAYGAPTRVRNAEGRENYLLYDTNWPGLVRETRTPSGLITDAFYAVGSGLLDSTRVYNPLGDGQIALTTYTWDPTWRAVKSIVGPTGLIDSITYDATTGNRLWEQRGGSTHRVTYSYDGSNQLSTITEPGSIVTTIGYNALGNVANITSPKGYVSLHYQNMIGQDTLIATPAGDTAHASSFSASYFTRVLKRYTIVGQDSVTTTYGPAVTLPSPYAAVGADSLRVEHGYDAEGNAIVTRRKFSVGGSAKTLRDSAVFDGAGRLSFDQSPTSYRTHFRDLAGNDTGVLSSRNLTVSMRYDALNRMDRRIVPQVTYSSTSCSSLFYFVYGCGYQLPTIGTGVCINADTSRFVFDPAGNMVHADNRWAHVRRAYTPGGLLSTDTLQIRTVQEPGDTPCESAGSDPNYGGNEWLSHTYIFTNTYSRAGQRLRRYGPFVGGFALPACSWAPCLTEWTYDSATGALASVYNPLGLTTTLGYDAGGRLTSLAFGNGTVEYRTLDPAGNVTQRLVQSTSANVINDTVAYDAAGRVARGVLGLRDGGSYGGDVKSWYGPIGAVVLASGVATGAGGTTYESFTTDAIGNRLTSKAEHTRPSWHPDTDGARNYFIGPTGQLDSVTAPANASTGFYSGKRIDYDASGNVTLTRRQEMDAGSNAMWSASAQYYDAADRLMVFSRAVGPYANDESHPGERNVFEQYRYDALGRRVLVRSRRPAGPSACPPSTASECANYVERAVWDGDELVAEIRADGSTGASTGTMDTDGPVGTSGNSYAYGRVVYTHAGGVDQPVAVARIGLQSLTDPLVVYPHLNWRGSYEVGTMPSGGVCSVSGGCGGITIAWPGAHTTTEGVAPQPADGPSWIGSLIPGGADGSGQAYRRNRYYDPSTGRFTQEDPIGLGGGMNQYGFAGGDPVNFADPFGLCPITAADPTPCGLTGAAIGGVAGAGIGVAITAGCASVTVGLCAVGGPAIIGASAGLGSIIGGLFGTATEMPPSDATSIVSALDWGTLKRRVIIGGALVGGALIGEGKDIARVIRDVIRTEQQAEQKKKKDQDEERRKKREGGGQGEPPPDPSPPTQ